MASKLFLFICLAVTGVLEKITANRKRPITALYDDLSAAPPDSNERVKNDVSIFTNRDTTNRIVGGSLAPPGSVPWKVALTTGTQVTSFMCGGSIIGRRHVLSAAHCIDAAYNSWTGLISSLRGRYGTQSWNSGGLVVAFSRNITHPHYVEMTVKNDIGVLITQTDIQLSNTARILPLNYNYATPGTRATVSGYGVNQQSGGWIQAQLLQVDLTIISEEECVLLRNWMAANGNFGNVPRIEYHLEICTFEDIGKGTCNGDSGSALVRKDTSQGVGVVSWGFPCAIGGPDIFSRISTHRQFIENALRQF